MSSDVSVFLTSLFSVFSKTSPTPLHGVTVHLYHVTADIPAHGRALLGHLSGLHNKPKNLGKEPLRYSDRSQF
jgi:hypothetical protein